MNECDECVCRHAVDPDCDCECGCHLPPDALYVFDSFEISKVAEFPDPHGGTFVERLDGTEEEGWRDEAIDTFWTLYGHIEGEWNRMIWGACEAIADFPTHAQARRVAEALAFGRPIADDWPIR